MKVENSKKGISLVALIITIIVLIILTGTVLLTGSNVPRNTEYAIKMNNQAVVQDAVTLYIMNSMLDGMDEYDSSYSGTYTVKHLDDIVPELYDVSSQQWTTNATELLRINLTQEELQATFTLDSKGIVGWIEGKEPIIGTDNREEEKEKNLVSIAVEEEPTKTTYEVGDVVDMAGLVVIATYEDTTTVDITNKVVFTPILSEITQTTGTKEITVTYKEKTATITIEVKEAHAKDFRELTPSNYGETVNYIANGKSDWQLYYATEEYVYLIASTSIGNTRLWAKGDVEKANASSVYNIMKLGQDGYQLKNNYISSLCVADLVNNYSHYANYGKYMKNNEESYVVGAIGAPTLELVAARVNTVTEGKMNLSYGDMGYNYSYYNWTGLQTGISINEWVWLTAPFVNEGLSYPEKYLLLASPSKVTGRMKNTSAAQLLPVVCLERSIPANWNGTSWDLSSSIELTSITISEFPTKEQIYALKDNVNLEGMSVTAIYSDGSQADVTKWCTYNPSLEEITSDVGVHELTVSFGGFTANEKINITARHAENFSELTAANFGETVNYVANGISDWKIYYKDEITINGQKEEYVYLMAWADAGYIITPNEGDVTIANNSEIYKIMKLGQNGYILDSANKNSLWVASLINDYQVYANTTDYIDVAGNSYVVGAIGGPTLELVAARINSIIPGDVIIKPSTYGYLLDAGDYIFSSSDFGLPNLYSWYLMASPCASRTMYQGNSETQLIEVRNGDFYNICIAHFYTRRGILPVVAIKASIPAIWNGTSWEI